MTLLRRRIAVAAWFGFLTALAACFAWYQVYTEFSFWDDEGTMMASVQQALQGHKLYSEVITWYGPFYYWYACGLRIITGTPVTHDAVRLSTLLPWLAAPLLFAWIVLRLTRSLGLASIAHLASVLTLAFTASEPGHPQELCILLVALLLAASFFLQSPRWHAAALIALGFLAAALALIKVNIGIFALVGLGTALFSAAPRRPLSNLVRWGLAAAGLALPFALMRVHFDDPVARAYAVVVASAWGAVVCVLFARETRAPSRAPGAWTAAASSVATIALALTLLAAQGIPLRTTLDSLVLVHLKVNVQQPYWYAPPPLSPWWVVWALAGAASAVVSMRAGFGRPSVSLAALRLLFGAGVLVMLCTPLSDALLGFATPFCWLVLIPPDESRQHQRAPRAVLCALTVLLTLYAYPIAGSQLQFVTAPLVICGIVCLGDALAYLVERRSFPALLRARKNAVLAAVLVIVAAVYAVNVRDWRTAYGFLPSLALPGARRIHLEASQANEYQWLARNLRQRCDTFFGLPGLPSLYFWTGLEPPLHANLDNWIYGLTPQQQQDVVQDLSQFPSLCVVYSPYILEFWNRNNMDLSKLPLVNYLQTRFKVAGQVGDYRLMIRNERTLPQ